MINQIFARYFLLSFCLLLSPLLLAANANLQAPQVIIDNTSQILLNELKNPAFAQDKNAVRAFVDTHIFPKIDTVRMSALVLGKHWRTANTEQKKRFIAAFKNLLVNTYASTFTEQFSNWTIDYLPLDIKPNDKTILVKTKVLQAGKPDAQIDYSMVKVNDQWKIYDLKVEGISLIISNRESFNQMIQDSGSLDQVIADIEAKNKQ